MFAENEVGEIPLPEIETISGGGIDLN